MKAAEWVRRKLELYELLPDDVVLVARVAQRALDGMGEAMRQQHPDWPKAVAVDGMPGKATLLLATLADIPHRQPTGEDLARLCRLQVGDRYVFGHEVRLADPDPDTFDCSELVQWATALLGVPLGDGSWRQLQRCQQAGTVIPVEQALVTVGALLFEFRDSTGHVAAQIDRRPARAHIEVSLGDGRTVGARSPRHGVDVFPLSQRWTHAALVPGLRYG